MNSPSSRKLLSEVDGPELLNTPVPHLQVMLEDAVKKNPNSEALVCRHQAEVNGLPGINAVSTVSPTRFSLTYQQLYDAASKLASKLTESGIVRGNVIAVFSSNRVECAVFCWAAVIIGCVFAPVNPKAVNNQDDIRRMMGDVGASVIVAMDSEIATAMEKHTTGEQESAVLLKIIMDPSSESDIHGWISLESLWTLSTPQTTSTDHGKRKNLGKVLTDTATIIFTSGTTSTPKACGQSSENIVVAALGVREWRKVNSSDRLVHYLPPFASMATIVSFTYWICGATIVYPSMNFDIPAILDAIEEEKCTVMTSVPTMLKAFSMHPYTGKADLSSLRAIDLGGALTHSDSINIGLSRLKSRSISLAWGMTEALGPIVGEIYEQELEPSDDSVPVGKPVAGCSVRICAPCNKTPLERGAVGELHVGGLVVARYLDESKNDTAFYSDNGKRWAVTGDMAMMLDSGVVQIMGRYKDVIIRGGLNIAPAKIEHCLDKYPGVESQVVGIQDDLAGEVPIAIVKLSKAAAEDSYNTILSLQELALESLAPYSMPQRFLSLHKDLGLESFPTTQSGKVRKTELSTRVLEFMKLNEKHDGEIFRQNSTADMLAAIWAEVSGLSVRNIDRGASIFMFADSITAMRFSTTVKRKMKKSILVEDIARNPSIQEQAHLLDSRVTITPEDTIQQRVNAPGASDMVHCKGQEAKAVRTQQLAAPMLQKLNITWEEDVEDVFPAPDTIHIYLWRRRPQTWNHRSVFIAPNVGHDTLLGAWKSTIKHHAILRTIAIGYNEDGENCINETGKGIPFTRQLIVVLRDNNRWWDCSIQSDLDVECPEDLHSVLPNDFADPLDGPLVRVGIVRIRSTNSSALLILGQHSTFDNLSIDILMEDLNKALEHGLSAKHPMQAPGHVPFKEFADSCYTNRQGPSSLEAIAFHTSKLRGIGELKSSLWPPSRAEGSFKGDDKGWTSTNGKLGDSSLRIPLDPEGNRRGVDGVTKTAPAKQLDKMRTVYGIFPHVILKTAVALVNASRTKTQTALFANMEAGRSWPFVNDWTTEECRSKLRNPLDIAGPTVHTVVNRIDLDNEEKVINLLRRIQDDQTLLSRYCQAPLFEIADALSPEDAEMMHEVLPRQCYNWAPGIQGAAVERGAAAALQQSRKLVKFSHRAYDDLCLAWTCGLWDSETLFAIASYDDCQLSAEEAGKALDEVLCAAVWLANPENANEQVKSCMFDGFEVNTLIDSQA